MRKVGTENVVLSTDGKFNGMIKLNAIAADLWSFFESEHNEVEAVEYILSRYDAERSIVEKDVKDFVDLIAKNEFAI